jgi:hypothetical protein
MTTGSVRGVAPRVELRIGDPNQAHLAAVAAPHVTVLRLLTDAVGGMRRGLPEQLRKHVARGVGAEERAAILPLAQPGASLVPDCVLRTPDADLTMSEQVETLRETGGDAVAKELSALFGEDVPGRWRGVVGDPDRWLADYARATEEAWSAYAPIWGRGRPLLDREAKRVDTAVVRGTADALLANLHPRLRFRDGVLSIDSPRSAAYELGDRRLVLVPTMGTRNDITVGFDLPDIAWVGYPVPGLSGLWQDPDSARPSRAAVTAPDALTLLLGKQRGALLRLAAKPVGVGALAAALGCAPSTATYQCAHLAAAGLITRERRGREVHVQRTERGDALVDLLMSGP